MSSYDPITSALVLWPSANLQGAMQRLSDTCLTNPDGSTITVPVYAALDDAIADDDDVDCIIDEPVAFGGI